MEFPVEIQMLIKDYLRPITRNDWRKGSYMTRQYKLDHRAIHDLTMYEDFKEYIEMCRMPPKRIRPPHDYTKQYKMRAKDTRL
jgi:hypothetical protein